MASRRLPAVLACALVGWLAACSSGAAAAGDSLVMAAAAAPSVATAAATQSPAAAPGPVVAAPDLVGLDLDGLADLAADAGLSVRVVAFAAPPGGSADPALVTVQDPPAGMPLRPGRGVMVWLGTPPEPPPGPRAEDSATPPAPADPVVAHHVPVVATTAAPSAAPAAAAIPEPGTRRAPTAPSAARSNIRTMPAAEPGTRLVGRASWYGEELRGSPVACGGRFDPDAATIASRELRCGTRVRITTADGSTTEAVVTDWGPAEWTGKRLDLSHAVFQRLAPLTRGWVDVEVVVLAG